MFSITRIGINSPLGIYISNDKQQISFQLPSPSQSIEDPLECEQLAGLLSHPEPDPSDFAKARKALIRKIYLPTLNTTLEIRAFRWWGDWYEDLEIEQEEDLVLPVETWSAVEPEFDISTMKFHARRCSPLRVLELRIEEQRFFTIEVPQLLNNMSRINPYIYEPWKGEAWVPYIYHKSKQREFLKLLEYMRDDGA